MTPPKDAVALPSGGHMPLLGFGTWQLKGRSADRATGWALAAGYRHLDTATIYKNEAEVGGALESSGVDRGDVFVTTKCPPRNAGREIETLQASLAALRTDHVDLWLIHWPGSRGPDTVMWQAFVEARDRGLARAIGVSNYSLDQIDELTELTGTKPEVNQVEWSPLLFDRAVLDGHRARGVVLEGYSALRGGTLEHPEIVGIAERLGRTPAQVIIRWHVQHEIVVIPKSAQQDRIRANADVDDFHLGDDDMARLDGLGGGGS